jgi:gamma-glutamylcyclotransferase (GGCT)/AIG2-like uncharacterized protein YtfP
MKIPSPVTSSTTQSLFVYGTLMAPAVTQTLLRRLPVHCPAILQPLPALPLQAGGSGGGGGAGSYSFRRHPVKSQVFPGLVLVRDSDSQTAAATTTAAAPVPIHGMLYSDLTPTEMKVLDWFEDEDEYTRTDCHVLVQPQQEVLEEEVQQDTVVSTQVYVWNEADETQLHMDRDWSFDHFRENALEWFLEHTVRPCREELDQLGM